MSENAHTPDLTIAHLRDRLDKATANSDLEILRIKNNRILDQVLGQIHDEEMLDDLSVDEVFARCLTAYQVPEDQRPELLRTYQETIASLQQNDARAE
ncbi:exonuclease SbcCD subunit D C-terminal domain-containing protein [Acidithiobacillus ferrooxidans]|uniref:exonuclease SbcCD subunit D C-terminal domain-containing protein n=1 Tax=Acidithiobacillus ferrooxidans TaxID=920 RepID=UPI001F24D040|nr:exonuclease SbcCD subunit D C-terminal domain-containing protein [Acidithiobacillus ferrooxidans]